VAGAHADVVPAQCFLNIIKRIANLSCERLASYAMDDVLVLTFRKFGTAAKRLPQPDRGDMSYCFASHEIFDSVSGILGAR
jgi:hypothetical protein